MNITIFVNIIFWFSLFFIAWSIFMNPSILVDMVNDRIATILFSLAILMISYDYFYNAHLEYKQTKKNETRK